MGTLRYRSDLPYDGRSEVAMASLEPIKLEVRSSEVALAGGVNLACRGREVRIEPTPGVDPSERGAVLEQLSKALGETTPLVTKIIFDFKHLTRLDEELLAGVISAIRISGASVVVVNSPPEVTESLRRYGFFRPGSALSILDSVTSHTALSAWGSLEDAPEFATVLETKIGVATQVAAKDHQRRLALLNHNTADTVLPEPVVSHRREGDALIVVPVNCSLPEQTSASRQFGDALRTAVERAIDSDARSLVVDCGPIKGSFGADALGSLVQAHNATLGAGISLILRNVGEPLSSTLERTRLAKIMNIERQAAA